MTPKTKIDLIKIKQDFCGNVFGSAPCSAAGEPCYNTFPTCKDQSHFTKGEKVYEFISGDLPAELVSKYKASPYIKSVGELPTEIKESDTIVKVLKDTLLDSPYGEIGTDPYYKQRAKIKGSFWKKWIARNRNYKGRFIERYEGNELLSKNDFKLKFAGRIENITLDNNQVTIEATDILKKLSEIEYPLKTPYSVKEKIPKVFICGSEEEMNRSKAAIGDLAERIDFKEITIDDSITQSGGMDSAGEYIWEVYAFDQYNRVFAKTDPDGIYDYFVTADFIDIGESQYISWNSVENASYYKVFYKRRGNSFYSSSNKLYERNYTINKLNDYEQKDPPVKAELFYRFLFDENTTANKWIEKHEIQTVIISANTDINDTGYIKIDKEIIYYSGKLTGLVNGVLSDALLNVRRHQFNSEPDSHPIEATVFVLFNEPPQNPFTLLKKILSRAGISQYASQKFTEYEQSWFGINFSCPVIAKEMKLNKIYFDLVNVLDCISWVSENGVIEVLKRTERPGNYKTISDKANIIDRSGKVDLNEGSRFTSWYLYWNKWNVEADNEDATAYQYANNLIDTDVESPSYYNDKIEDKQFTIWINTDCAPIEQIHSYVNNLLESRRKRTREAQTIYECDLHKKDGLLETGELFKLSTNDIQDIYGNAAQNKLFRVIKKTVKGDKFNIKAVDTSQQL